MTIYTVLKLCDQLEISMQEKVTVAEDIADVKGTSAMLLPGDILTIEQLLYGLMLPSGNDAA
jgi:D-alanyl-D-alanine carboxypeptidase (penicillin-binding protein 5/6)